MSFFLLILAVERERERNEEVKRGGALRNEGSAEPLSPAINSAPLPTLFLPGFDPISAGFR